MEILYKNNKVEKLCTDYKIAKKELGLEVSEKLFAAINMIESATNLKDIRQYRPFNLHKLTGDLDGIYSIYLGKKTGYRLEIIPLDKDKNVIVSEDMSIYIVCVCVKIERVSNHYE